MAPAAGQQCNSRCDVDLGDLLELTAPADDAADGLHTLSVMCCSRAHADFSLARLFADSGRSSSSSFQVESSGHGEDRPYTNGPASPVLACGRCECWWAVENPGDPGILTRSLRRHRGEDSSPGAPSSCWAAQAWDGRGRAGTASDGQQRPASASPRTDEPQGPLAVSPPRKRRLWSLPSVMPGLARPRTQQPSLRDVVPPTLPPCMPFLWPPTGGNGGGLPDAAGTVGRSSLGRRMAVSVALASSGPALRFQYSRANASLAAHASCAHPRPPFGAWATPASPKIVVPRLRRINATPIWQHHAWPIPDPALGYIWAGQER
jgi:hypothetical protein